MNASVSEPAPRRLKPQPQPVGVHVQGAEAVAHAVAAFEGRPQALRALPPG